MGFNSGFKGLNAKLNSICHVRALLGAQHILHISRIRVKKMSGFLMGFKRASSRSSNCRKERKYVEELSN